MRVAVHEAGADDLARGVEFAPSAVARPALASDGPAATISPPSTATAPSAMTPASASAGPRLGPPAQVTTCAALWMSRSTALSHGSQAFVEVEQGGKKHAAAVDAVVGVGEFLRRVADAVLARHEDHGVGAECGHVHGVVAGAAGHRA